MHAKKYESTPSFELFGNTYRMILPRDITECTEAALVTLKKDRHTPSHRHLEEEQIYFILGGEGLIRIKGEQSEVKAGMVIFIPRGAEHEIISHSERLSYIYVAVWLDRVPNDDNKWIEAYKKLGAKFGASTMVLGEKDYEQIDR